MSRVYDDFNIRELCDQLWDSRSHNYECTECKKPCGTEIEWCDDNGRPNGTFVCEVCADANEVENE
jgi:hypothetical protein